MAEEEIAVPSPPPVLDKFRKFSRGHINDFLAARDRVLDLVGGSQKLMIGLAREDLLRRFLRDVLPSSLSVDSGIVYGFEKVENSKQIDVLVWDSSRTPPVFRGESFVVVAPESVIAAISVKTASNQTDIVDSIQNLASLAPLEDGFRAIRNQQPIAKIAFFYSPVAKIDSAAKWIAAALKGVLEKDPERLRQSVEILKRIDPSSPEEEDVWHFERLLPRLFVHLGDPGQSFARGWGPPNMTLDEAVKQRLRRRPFVYPQEDSYTSPLEKLVYHVMQDSMLEIGSPAVSLVSAWGDFHPQFGFKVGDASELMEGDGVEVWSEHYEVQPPGSP